MAKHITTYSRFALYVSWSILLLGIALRIIVFLQNRSLFLDEANLALNYATKSFPDLFAQLDNRQYAPPFFSVVEKVNVLLFGVHEYSLRILPLLSGIALLYFFIAFVKNILTRLIFGSPWP